MRDNDGTRPPRRPALRSRGFLSHGGAPASTQTDAGEALETPPSRARARRSHEGVGERAPRALDLPAPRRPYDLEDE